MGFSLPNSLTPELSKRAGAALLFIMSAGYSFQIHHPGRNVACVLGFSWPLRPQITATPASALMRISRSRLPPNQNTPFVFCENRRIKAQSGPRVTDESNLLGYCCFFFHQESKRRWLKTASVSLASGERGAVEEPAVFIAGVFWFSASFVI